MGAKGTKEAPPLTPQQRKEIIRLRVGGMELKQIARTLRCSYNQVQRCWLNSDTWKKKREAARRIKERTAALHETAVAREVRKRQQAFEREMQAMAQRAALELKREIALAVQEMAVTKEPFKKGLLSF